MKRRIFRQMMTLLSCGTILLTAILCGVFYSQFSLYIRDDLRQRTRIFAGDDRESALDNLSLVRPDDMRVTILSQSGEILFDNMAEAPDDRYAIAQGEIDEALARGKSEGRQFSNAFGGATYSYSIRLTDGTVLRAARTTGGVWRMFLTTLPVTVAAVLLLLAVGYLASARAAQKVFEPIAEVSRTGEASTPYDELVPFARAINEQHRQILMGSEQLEERTATINAIMENMAEGVVLLDHSGVILSLNRSAAHIFGSFEPMRGKSALALLRDMNFHERIQQALQGQRGEMTFQKRNKEYRVLLSPASRIGIVVLILDITERSATERMRREFSANVSHELKTPLTSIYGNAEMLHGGVVRESDRPAFYKKIMDEAYRLIDLIDDIIMLSELDEENSRKRLEQVDLVDVAEECADALGQKADEHGVQIGIAGAGSITANRSLMYEMLYNLIDNGIKYNVPGGHVKIDIQQTAEGTKIMVADNGIGISAGDQDRIFERFYRSDKSRSKKSGGSGLGLAIVKHIVMVHDGSIRVQSELGKGTAFIVLFAQDGEEGDDGGPPAA